MSKSFWIIWTLWTLILLFSGWCFIQSGSEWTIYVATGYFVSCWVMIMFYLVQQAIRSTGRPLGIVGKNWYIDQLEASLEKLDKENQELKRELREVREFYERKQC